MASIDQEEGAKFPGEDGIAQLSSLNPGSDDVQRNQLLDSGATSAGRADGADGQNGGIRTGEKEMENKATQTSEEDRNDDDEGSDTDVREEEPEEGVNFNLEILEHLCSVSPVEYLAKFRYVSREWNEAALKSWRKEAQLVVVDYYSKPRKISFEKYLNLPDLIKRMENPDDPSKLDPAKEYSYHKYKLEYWYLTNKNPNMVKFWGNLGTSINRLELSNLRVDRIGTLLGILYEKVPNLHTLILDKVFVKIDDVPGESEKKVETSVSIPPQTKLKVLRVRSLKHFPVNWTAFLHHFPNIQVFESFNVKSDGDLQRILIAIQQIRLASSKDVLALKSLAIYRGDSHKRCVRSEFSHELMRILMACDFQLEELHVKLGCITLRSIAENLLSMFTVGLKKLTFHIDYKCKKPLIFPYLVEFPDLEELDLIQWCKPQTKLKTLLKSMPNLKVLKISGIEGNPFCLRDAYYMKVIARKDTLEDICHSLMELSFITCKLSVFKFEYLTLMAPNLTKLELNVDDKIFRAICKKFPNLTELRAWGEGLTDVGVTGLSPNRGWKEPSNITVLKKLRVFVLHDVHHLLTNVSVFHGFLRLESLFTLQLALPDGQISQEAREALEENIPNLVVA